MSTNWEEKLQDLLNSSKVQTKTETKTINGSKHVIAYRGQFFKSPTFGLGGIKQGVGEEIVSKSKSSLFNACCITNRNLAVSKYEGQWVKDQKHGQGRETNLQTGEVYVGPFKNGERFGNGGTVTKTNGTSYTGGFKNGKKHGTGELRYKDGYVYNGTFENNRRHGYGKEVLSNKDSYEGEYEKDKRHGLGRIILANGDIYECNFEKGHPITGPGKIILAASGNVYEGDLDNFIRHGQGKLTYKNGNIYTGQYKDGIKHGQA